MHCTVCRSEMQPGKEFCLNCGARQAHGQSPQRQGYPPQSQGLHQPGHHPRPHAPPGKTMLMVVGILMIVFSVFSLLTSAVFLATADYWDRVLPIASGMSWTTYYAILIVSGLFSLVIGIVAVANCGKPQNAGMLKTLAVISIAGVVVWYIFALQSSAIAATGFTVISMIGLPFDLILPILLFVGAHRNHQSLGTSRPY